MYNFDPAEEQDDLEQELLDHGRESTLTGPNAKVNDPEHTPRQGWRASTVAVMIGPVLSLTYGHVSSIFPVCNLSYVYYSIESTA